MSDTKKMLGKKSRDIGRQNRAKIYAILTQKTLTFTELLNETKLSRAALNNHLKALETEKRIERIVKDKRIAYKSKTDKKSIIAGIKAYLEPLEELASILEKKKGAFFTHLVIHFVHEYLEFIIEGNRTQDEIKEFVEDWFSQENIGEVFNGSG